ncbi:MAG: SRPBCC family protein [Acidimicrobiales bacterium]
MARIRVSRVIEAPVDAVWEEFANVSGHVEWMDDALSIDFTSPQRSGVGTTYACATRIGLFRTTDHMEIVEWEPGRSIGVRHVGVVTGVGQLSMRRAGRARPPRPHQTKVTWDERLRFPWWLGGPVTAQAAKPVLRRVWKRNLRNLEALVRS